MAGQYPAPLPSLGLNLAPGLPNVAGAPAYLPSVGLVLSATGGSPLTAAAGAFVLTGQVAALKSGHKVVSAAGVFTETGIASTLTKASIGGGGDASPLPSLGLMLVRAAGSKVVFGANAAFALSGVAESLIKGVGITAATGTYLLNGAPAQRDLQITADKATFAVTPVAAALSRASQGITASSGAFVLTGNSAGLAYQTANSFVLPALRGQYVLTGNAATFPTQIARTIIAGAGSFATTGGGATFTAVHWAPMSQSAGTWTSVAPTSNTTWTNA